METSVGVQEIARRISIPIAEIADALGLPNPEETELQEKLKKVSTPEQARRIYKRTLPDSEIREQAFLKWLELVSTPEEASNLHELALPGSEIREQALLKLTKLVSEKLRQVSTPEEARVLYERTPSDSEIRKQVIRTLVSLTK